MSFRPLFRTAALLACVVSLVAAAWAAFGPDWQSSASQPESPTNGATPARETQGELVFDRTEIDLGPVREQAECSFHFENRSAVPLTIHSVKPSCSRCTVAKLTQDTYPPGSRGTITVSARPRTEQIGAQSSQIIVEYTAEARRSVRLFVRLKYQPDVLVPSEIAVRCVPGRPAIATFTLDDFRDTPLKITEITTSSPAITAAVRRTPDAYLPGWQYEIGVTLRKGTTVSEDRREQVILHTSDPDRRAIAVGVLLKHVARIRVAPSVLVLASDRTVEGAASGRLHLDDTEGEVVSIGAVTPSHAGLNCTLDKNGSARPVLDVRYVKGRHQAEDRPLAITLEVLSPVKEVVCVKVLARPR